MSTWYCESLADSYLVNLSGALSASRAEEVIQLFRGMAEQGVQGVVVNLEEVPFIDSRGLAALVAGYKLFGRAPQSFRLTGVQDQPRLVLELTGFDQVFEILPYLPSLPCYHLPVLVPQRVALEDLAA